MNLNAIASLVSTMFPQLPIAKAIEQAQQKTQGVNDDFDSVKSAIEGMGISGNQLETIAGQILSHPQAKKICNAVGVNPQLLAKDLKKLAEGNNNKIANAPKIQSSKKHTKFPKIK